MQVRILTTAAALAILAATSAFAQQSVQTQPAEGRFDAFLEIDGVKGESRDPPPPPPPSPPPPEAPSPEHGVQAQGADGASALIVPAIQRVREAAQSDALTDGLMILRSAPEDETAASGNGGVWKTSDIGPSASATREVTREGEGIVPELPICGHCGADVPPPPQESAVMPEQPACAHCGADILQQQEPAEAPRPRRVFSLSIGGVTLSSDGGVAVAVGDINGDGRGNRSGGSDAARAPARPTGRR